MELVFYPTDAAGAATCCGSPTESKVQNNGAVGTRVHAHPSFFNLFLLCIWNLHLNPRMSYRSHIWTCTMSGAGRKYRPVSYREYNVMCFLIVSDCATTSTSNDLKYLLHMRSLIKPSHTYKQQLTFPLTFFFFKDMSHDLQKQN